jgi:RHS repeat-associated protein
LAGRRTRLTWPDTFYVTYDHLLTGETTAIRENGAASGIGVIASLAYDGLGRRESLTLGNGVATSYRYDPVSRLDELRLEFAGTANDLTSSFDYNPASQIVSTTRSNDAYAWTGHGSGTTSTTADGLNRIASWVNTLSYDAKGNVTSDGTYTYDYSSENLLTSLANSAQGGVQTSTTYAYDPLMRLAVIDSNNSAFDVRLGYDGQEMAYEGLSDNRTRRYVYGPGIDEPLVGYLVTGTGTSRLWYQADERGSITRLSNDAGTPGGIGKFDEYGIGGTSRFRYTGQYWLGDANLLYYRARVYDARLGRFLQPDPIGYGAGMNLYAYVGGDPINWTDSLGLEGEPIVVTCDWVCQGRLQFSNLAPALGGHSGANGGGTRAVLVGGESSGGVPAIDCGEMCAEITTPKPKRRAISLFPPYLRIPNPLGSLDPDPNDACGSKGSDRIPDLIGGADLSGACLRHDRCYASSTPKRNCDSRFFTEVKEACIETGVGPIFCYPLGAVYFLGVSFGGEAAYRAARPD